MQKGVENSEELQKILKKDKLTKLRLEILVRYGEELQNAAQTVSPKETSAILEQMATVPRPVFRPVKEKVKVSEANSEVTSLLQSFTSVFTKTPPPRSFMVSVPGTNGASTQYVFVPDEQQCLYGVKQTIQLMSSPMKRPQAEGCVNELRKQLDQQGAWGLAISIYPSSSKPGYWRVYITGNPEVLNTLLTPSKGLTPSLDSKAQQFADSNKRGVAGLLEGLTESKLCPDLEAFDVQANTLPQNVMALSNPFAIGKKVSPELGKKLKELNNTYLSGAGVHLTLTINPGDFYQIMVLGSPSVLQSFVREMSSELVRHKKPWPLRNIQLKRGKENFLPRAITTWFTRI